jgi:hypothetical protein
MTFAVGFTWISATLLAFIHMAKNAIFLYEFFEEPGRIKFIKALELPPLCDGGRLNFAHCLSEQNPIVYRTSHPAPATGRLPPRFPFRHNAADGIACFILGVSLEEIPGASVTIAIVVHRRALVALTSAASSESTATAATISTSTAVASADADSDEQQQQQQQQQPQRQAVPWDSWGPPVTRCLEVPYWRRCRGPTGQRWGMLAHDELVLLDFNPHNVRRAAAQLLSEVPASQTTTTTTGGVLRRRHENGNRTRVVSSPTLLTAGLCFRDDVTSNLSYVETRAVCTSPSRWENVLTDDERLLGLYFKEVCVSFPSDPGA